MSTFAIFFLLPFFRVFGAVSNAEIITSQESFGLSEIEAEVADRLDWKNHACRRNCKDDGKPLDCYYTFKIEDYYTMSKACYDCPFNVTDCFRSHCVPADGAKRSILAVNRQIPGPAIEVCQGDRVIVDVVNSLISESTTMHWHGQHQAKTPYMDGVPFVSQCPIPPHSSFRYDFFASEHGTHFWHSHLGFQRGDGLFGPLIVRVPAKKDKHYDFYDVDEHVILVLDWTHELGIDKFLAHHHKDGDNKAPNLLVNGLGRYRTMKRNETTANMPTATFIVKQNLRYRFRLINAEFLNCPIEISVDNHTMHVMSSDGRDIQPIEAKSLVSYAGERFDFILKADRKIDNYWIRFRGLMDCDERFFSAHQVAILRYQGAPEVDPNSTVAYNPPENNVSGVRVNALNEGTESNESVSIPLLRSLDVVNDYYSDDPDYKFFISYDFYDKDNLQFHRKNLYGFHQVKKRKERLFTPQLNHISMKFPGFPLLSQREMIDESTFCNSSTIEGCEKDFCACTHVLRVKNNSLVELILIDEGFTFDANHPFHLHGYQFRVLGMERLGSNVTVDRVKNLDAQGLLKRNFHGAPLKDTVTVPDGGYTIVRFRANNPGYWLFHCHIEFHAEVGMAIIFKVGEHSDFPPVPRDFPRCGKWRANDSIEKYDTTVVVNDHTTDFKVNEIAENRENRTFLMDLIPLILKDFGYVSSSSGISEISPKFPLHLASLIFSLWKIR